MSGVSSPFTYVSAFLRDKAVASVSPSSRYLAARVVDAMAAERARTVVEYGPAEGVITERILSRMAPDAVLVAVERNGGFARTLRRRRDPRLRVVHGDAWEIEPILRRLGLGPADVIVSGIPFSHFDAVRRHELLRRTRAQLAPHGRFVAYQCTTHLSGALARHFRKVDTAFEVRNLPPHFVFTAYP